MHSPLPDASALEAGILEDTQPSRLSSVQDNVRNLLQTTIYGSAGRVLLLAHDPPNVHNGLVTPPDTPMRDPAQLNQPEISPIPAVGNTFETAEIATSDSSSPAEPDIGVLGDITRSAGSRVNDAQTAHESALFNSRAVAALDHPDLSDPSLATLARRKIEQRQRKAWKRSRHGRRRHAMRTALFSLGSFCVLSALLLGAMVSTYVILATTSDDVSTTFHVLFILGIMLATIVFVHTVARICWLSRHRSSSSSSSRSAVSARDTLSRRRHRRHHGLPRLQASVDDSARSNDNTTFVPTTPIHVHVESDQVRPDSREAEPSAGVHQPPEVWNKDLAAVPPPPPAYGRWRGSVRANPELLHWQPVPSPIIVEAADETGVPSPTYEEALAENQTRPPSYVTRASPVRRRDELLLPVQESGAAGGSHIAQVQRAVRVEPEMVEVRAIGLAV